MKVFVALVVCLAVAQAYPSASYNSGSSTSTRKQDSYGNYDFAYTEQGATGGSSRSEKRTPHGTEGSYSLNVGDGRKRTVKYIADAAGFRATVITNEPGTEAKAPADVYLSAPAPAAPAYAASYAAPAYSAAPSYSAPSYSAQSYAAPSYSAPSYSAQSYSALPALPALPAAPAYSAPAYSAPAYPAQAYSAQAYSAPAYAAPTQVYAAPAPAYAKMAAPAGASYSTSINHYAPSKSYGAPLAYGKY